MQIARESGTTFIRGVCGSLRGRWPIAMIVCLGFAISASAACGAADTKRSVADSKTAAPPASQTPTHLKETLTAISESARAHDWVEIAGVKAANTTCSELLGELRTPKYIQEVKPRVEAETTTDSRLGEIARCANYQSKERTAAARPNNFIEGVRDFGDQSFRLYRVRLGVREPKIRDIVYGEFREDKVLTNAYMDGFTAVDLSNCTRLGGVPVQRQLDGDHAVSAPREVVKGLFALGGEAMVITVTEQIGHLQDPASFRAINVWQLKDDGVFVQSCAWSPKGLVERTRAGERK